MRWRSFYSGQKALRDIASLSLDGAVESLSVHIIRYQRMREAHHVRIGKCYHVVRIEPQVIRSSDMGYGIASAHTHTDTHGIGEGTGCGMVQAQRRTKHEPVIDLQHQIKQIVLLTHKLEEYTGGVTHTRTAHTNSAMDHLEEEDRGG